MITVTYLCTLNGKQYYSRLLFKSDTAGEMKRFEGLLETFRLFLSESTDGLFPHNNKPRVKTTKLEGIDNKKVVTEIIQTFHMNTSIDTKKIVEPFEARPLAELRPDEIKEFGEYGSEYSLSIVVNKKRFQSYLDLGSYDTLAGYTIYETFLFLIYAVQFNNAIKPDKEHFKLQVDTSFNSNFEEGFNHKKIGGATTLEEFSAYLIDKEREFKQSGMAELGVGLEPYAEFEGAEKVRPLFQEMMRPKLLQTPQPITLPPLTVQQPAKQQNDILALNFVSTPRVLDGDTVYDSSILLRSNNPAKLDELLEILKPQLLAINIPGQYPKKIPIQFGMIIKEVLTLVRNEAHKKKFIIEVDANFLPNFKDALAKRRTYAVKKQEELINQGLLSLNDEVKLKDDTSTSQFNAFITYLMSITKPNKKLSLYTTFLKEFFNGAHTILFLANANLHKPELFANTAIPEAQPVTQAAKPATKASPPQKTEPKVPAAALSDAQSFDKAAQQALKDFEQKPTIETINAIQKELITAIQEELKLDPINAKTKQEQRAQISHDILVKMLSKVCNDYEKKLVNDLSKTTHKSYITGGMLPTPTEKLKKMKEGYNLFNKIHNKDKPTINKLIALQELKETLPNIVAFQTALKKQKIKLEERRINLLLALCTFGLSVLLPMIFNKIDGEKVTEMLEQSIIKIR